jgi:hypothetical protein
MFELADGGLVGSTFTLWPLGDRPSKAEFNLTLFGCPLSETIAVKFMYHASVASIRKSYASLSNFVSEIQGTISNATRIPVDRFVLTFLGEVPGPKSTFEVRILPDYTAGSPSVTEVQSLLQSDPVVEALKRYQVWVKDESAEMCLNKECPDGSVCVDGNCASPSGESVVATMNGQESAHRFVVWNSGIGPLDLKPSTTFRFLVPSLILGIFLISLIGLLIWRTQRRLVKPIIQSDEENQPLIVN